MDNVASTMQAVTIELQPSPRIDVLGCERNHATLMTYVLYDKACPGEIQNTTTHPDRDPTINKSTDTTKVRFGEPMSLISVTYRNMREGLLAGAEITQR